MDKEKLVIIVILSIICVMGLFNFFILSESNKTININEIEIKVPDTSNKVINQTDHYSIYEDVHNGIVIYVFDTEGTSLNDVDEMFKFLTVRDVNQLETIPIEEKEYNFNYSNSLNEYTYLLNNNNKNIFVITKNKDDMVNIIKSIKNKSVENNKSNNYQETLIEDTVNFHPSFN